MGKNGYHGYKDLIVYKKAFELSIDIFKVTINFPKEERYSLTDQIRRSSRSIGANIAEAWAKRIYVKSFIAKLIDSMSESLETTHWLDESLALKYINNEKHKNLDTTNIEIQKMLNSMIKNPKKFCYKKTT